MDASSISSLTSPNFSEGAVSDTIRSVKSLKKKRIGITHPRDVDTNHVRKVLKKWNENRLELKLELQMWVRRT